MNEITPSDIEAKLLEISKELNTIPGAMSLAKKASPSIAALAGIWLKKVTKKESSNKQGGINRNTAISKSEKVPIQAFS